MLEEELLQMKPVYTRPAVQSTVAQMLSGRALISQVHIEQLIWLLPAEMAGITLSSSLGRHNLHWAARHMELLDRYKRADVLKVL